MNKLSKSEPVPGIGGASGILFKLRAKRKNGGARALRLSNTLGAAILQEVQFPGALETPGPKTSVDEKLRL